MSVLEPANLLRVSHTALQCLHVVRNTKIIEDSEFVKVLWVKMRIREKGGTLPVIA